MGSSLRPVQGLTKTRKMDAGTNKWWKQGLINGIKIWFKLGVYFEQKIQPNIYCDQVDSLQKTLENAIIFVIINIYI